MPTSLLNYRNLGGNIVTGVFTWNLRPVGWSDSNLTNFVGSVSQTNNNTNINTSNNEINVNDMTNQNKTWTKRLPPESSVIYLFSSDKSYI